MILIVLPAQLLQYNGHDILEIWTTKLHQKPLPHYFRAVSMCLCSVRASMTSCSSDAQIQARLCTKEVQQTVRFPADVDVRSGAWMAAT